ETCQKSPCIRRVSTSPVGDRRQCAENVARLLTADDDPLHGGGQSSKIAEACPVSSGQHAQRGLVDEPDRIDSPAPVCAVDGGIRGAELFDAALVILDDRGLYVIDNQREIFQPILDSWDVDDVGGDPRQEIRANEGLE